LSDKAPITIVERLRFAYAGAAPAEIVRLFERKSEFTPFDGYVMQGGPLVAAQQVARELSDARGRLQVAERLLGEFEAKLAALQLEYSAICEALDAPPPLTASPREIGLQAVDRAGYERLIPEVEKACAGARAEVERMKAHAENWQTLSEVASVIAGQTRPNETLARKIGASSVRF
jgi:hypothetical protein